jgi:hypothetical protein
VDSEDPSIFLNGRYPVTFFALESCTTVNSRKGVPAATSINARTWCLRPLCVKMKINLCNLHNKKQF